MECSCSHLRQILSFTASCEIEMKWTFFFSCVTGQWEQCCDLLVKVHTARSHKPAIFKRRPLRDDRP